MRCSGEVTQRKGGQWLRATIPALTVAPNRSSPYSAVHHRAYASFESAAGAFLGGALAHGGNRTVDQWRGNLPGIDGGPTQ
jgi:hypothetical protein